MKEKLSSRKFWVAVATFISALGVVFFDVEVPVEPLIGVAGVLVAYLFGQSWVDKTQVQGQADIVKNETLLQAQQYIAYLEKQVSDLGETNGSEEN